MITLDNILFARERIKNYIYTTPLELSYYLSSNMTKVYLKLECQQKLKSFKVRGALSKLTSLSKEEKARGVMAVSSGNCGAGVSYAASLLGDIKAKIFVPETIPGPKLEKIEYYGAEVIKVGQNYDGAHMAAMEAMKREKLTFVDPCSDVEVISGQGSIGLEILEQNPDIDVILAPIGGGGLITGLSIAAKSVKPSIKVIGVQTAACPAMVQALKDKVCYIEYPTEDTICDALVGGVGEIPYQMAGKCIDDIIVVEEKSIRKAVKLLITKDKVVAEPSGAIGVAALLENPSMFEGKNVAVVISGGNLDSNLMKQILNEEGEF